MPSSHSTIRMIAIVSSIAALLDQCIADAMRAVHVSALYAPVSNRAGCNRGATSGARRPSLTGWICSALFCLAVSPSAVPACHAQDTAGPPAAATAAGQRASATVSFLGGAVAGLVAHEAGHTVFDVAFGAEP